MSTHFDSADEFMSHLYGTLSDSTRWRSLESRALLELIFHGQVVYGYTNDQKLASYLRPAYEQAIEISTEPDRFACYRAVFPHVEEREASLDCLLPFIVLEPSARIVSTATIDFAMIGLRPDPMKAVHELVSYIEEGRARSRGAILGGLVCLGDRRVIDLVKPLIAAISPEEAGAAARCQNGFPTVPAFEFWLEWLERLPGDYEDQFFGACASALVQLVDTAKAPVFLDGERNLGCGLASDDLPYRVTHSYTTGEIGRKYRERLNVVEAREPEPKVMREVLARYAAAELVH